MTARRKLKRIVDEQAPSRAKKALGAKTEAEVARLSVERVAEMEEFWEFMKKNRRSLRPGSVRNLDMAVAIPDTNIYIDRNLPLFLRVLSAGASTLQHTENLRVHDVDGATRRIRRDLFEDV